MRNGLIMQLEKSNCLIQMILMTMIPLLILHGF